MHDSRGAALKVGDRVLIEAEITNLATSGDENFCVVDVQVKTPDQVGREKVMSAPEIKCMSTRMLTKIGAAIALLFAFFAFAGDAQAGPLRNRLKARFGRPAASCSQAGGCGIPAAVPRVAACNCAGCQCPAGGPCVNPTGCPAKATLHLTPSFAAPALSSGCPGGVCPAPARRGLFGWR